MKDLPDSILELEVKNNPIRFVDTNLPNLREIKIDNAVVEYINTNNEKLAFDIIS